MNTCKEKDGWRQDMKGKDVCARIKMQTVQRLPAKGKDG